MLRKILFEKIDNSQIVLFRIFFGLLMTVECWGAIGTGWVKETFVEPEFTFTFIGFEWTQFLLGETMYYVFGVLGFLGLMVSAGFLYRFSSVSLALGWSLVYFMQKSHYNNHYYMLMLVCWFMVFLPMISRYKSVDVMIRPERKALFTYHWARLAFMIQAAIMYFYATVAKFYPGWYNGDFLRIRYHHAALWFEEKLGWLEFATILKSSRFAEIIAWLGIGFDLLIVPLLLFRRTRTLAIIFGLIFHLFNSLTLHVGVFPYFSLALAIFFYPPETIRKVFFPRKPTFMDRGDSSYERKTLKSQKVFTFIFCFYVLWQIYLPLRHWHIPGDVLWTEEGHRLSWRMMLRTKSGIAKYTVKDKSTGETKEIDLSEYLTQHQIGAAKVKPDMMWQFAQYLKKTYAKQGKDIEVFVNSRVSVNGGPYHEFTDPTVDLASAKWKYFSHQDWIKEEPESYSFPEREEQ